MDVRNKIYINGLEWKLIFADNKTIKKVALETRENIDFFGLTVYGELTIYISTDIPFQLAERAATHELVHAMLFSFGLKQEEMTEEELCRFIEYNLYTLNDLRNQVLNILFERQQTIKQSLQTEVSDVLKETAGTI